MGLPIRVALSEMEAAVYLSISPSMFRLQRGVKNFPKAKKLGNRLIWGREDLDRYFNSLPYADGTEGKAYTAQESIVANDTPAPNPWRVKA